MKKIVQIVILGGIIFIIATFYFLNEKKNRELLESAKDKMIFFYGETCPHCANVEKFFEENEIEKEIQFEEKEVYNDKNNAKLLILVAKRKCNLKENEIGVPFLWDGENSKCTVGDQPIIDYFKEKVATAL